VILTVIIACEIGFWVAIVAGLAVRYLLRWPRLGAALLVCAPLLDLVLLAATAVHLRSGAEASWEHSLAALYVGFSVAYGHRLIHWADVRFAHRFADGPAPVKPYGADYARLCWGGVARTLLASAIAAAIIGLLVLLVGDADRTAPLLDTLPLLGLISGLDLLWAISYTVWPRRAPAGAARSAA
jgi:hypothetical protein